MVICYITDDRYAAVTGVSLLSLLDSNKDSNSITVYIVDDHITAENKMKFQLIAEQYNRELMFLEMPDVAGIFGEIPVVRRWTSAIYAKLVLYRILPESIDKVIFLDSDTLILASLSDVWAIDMKEMAVAGVNDASNGDIFKSNGLTRKEGQKISFINGGFYMQNLKIFRLPETEELIIDAVKRRANKDYFNDEAIIEYVFHHKIICLPPKYNSYQCFSRGLHRGMIHKRVKKHVPDVAPLCEWKEAFRDPVVIHFGGISIMRPFISGRCAHPYKRKYMQYRLNSPWAYDALIADTDRSIKKNISYLLYQFFPPVAHLLHYYLYYR